MIDKKIRLDWLDYGRFLSAFSVMCFHYLVNGYRLGKVTTDYDYGLAADIAEYGYLGVDFFFIVSGFVIMNSAQNRTPDEFASARLVRLWPAFLFCMTLTASVKVIWGGPGMDVTPLQYLANLTMFAGHFGIENIDGVYWTLALEILFYGAVFIVLALNLIRSAERIVEIWIIAMIATLIVGIRIPIVSGYFSLFAAGCIFSFVGKSGMNYRRLLFVLLSLAVSLIEVTYRVNFTVASKNIDLSVSVVATITILFFGIFLFFSYDKFAQIKLPFAQRLGALTYPLYLIHASIGYIALSSIGSVQNKWFTVAFVMICMIAASAGISEFVERRPAKLWRHLADSSVGSTVRFALVAFRLPAFIRHWRV